MAGFSMEVSLNDKGNAKELKRLEGKMTDLAPFYKNVGEHIQQTTPERFQKEEAPDGTKWDRLSPVTLEAREKRGTGSTKLREEGDLIGSINYQVSSDNFRWGSNLVYARIHQLGGEAGRNHEITIPARPYLGLSADDEEEILNIARDHVHSR